MQREAEKIFRIQPNNLSDNLAEGELEHSTKKWRMSWTSKYWKITTLICCFVKQRSVENVLQKYVYSVKKTNYNFSCDLMIFVQDFLSFFQSFCSLISKSAKNSSQKCVKQMPHR